MVYPKKIAEKLSFDQVVQAASDFCHTEKGLAHFDRIRFSSKPNLIHLWLNQTAELKEVLIQGNLNLQLDLDFDLQYESAHIEGFFYEIETILKIKDVITNLVKVDDFGKKEAAEYPNLNKLFSDIDIDSSLVSEIEKVIGPDSEVKPTASKQLQKVIGEIDKAQKSIIRNSNQLFTKAKDQGFLGDIELGIKNGRIVLPVLSEHKRKISGVLIDQSGTGKISYIEPLELVTLNNGLAELEIKKRYEIIQILRYLTQKLVIYKEDIRKGIQKLGVFDFIRAKARLALDWECVLPKITKQCNVQVAMHPILQDRLKAEGENIIPLDYQFNEEQKLIVISGPNAGGKSVALKTVGLLQYMLQCGFLVSCDASSTFRLYENIFIDIGDNQSIESDLSTYSSHLKAAKHIINFSDENTLVLMDEIGTGTDPMFGGPMAEAILEAIHHKGAQGIITTHFSNIKSKAEKLEGVENAAMLFDVENLVPLYKLQIGQPGSSFVYEVASNIGLNKKLIKRAKQLTNTKQYDLDVLLAEVQTRQEDLQEKQAEIEKKTAQAELIEREYKELKASLDEKKKEILDQANERANSIIQEANKDIEKTIREIKESKADKRKTKRIRERLEEKVKPKTSEDVTIVKSDIEVGDTVQLEGSSTIGEVVEIKKNKVTLNVGSLVTKTHISKVEKVGKKTEKKIKKYLSTKSYNDKHTSFKPEIDVRGMRTYDALAEIDQWLDSAIILGVGRLRILHGKGNGILKMEIRRHLKGMPQIAKISYERVDLGGEGISIIDLQ